VSAAPFRSVARPRAQFTENTDVSSDYILAVEAVRDDHRLVTEGPYRRVRHPMYTALIGNMTGLCLLSANLLIVVPRLVQIFLLLLRTRKEESMMLSRFGEEYRSYMGRSGRLFPPPPAR